MFDLSKQKITVTCTNCKRTHSATLNDVIKNRVIDCACGTNIRLEESNGSVSKGVKDVNKSFKDLENTIKKIGKK